MFEEITKTVCLKIGYKFTEPGNLTNEGDSSEENHLQSHSGTTSKANNEQTAPTP